ncbi:MAG: phosphoribosylanthranilate isomerase [Gemmataceae bacterium]|nr:phosphoribosylanthranilate isomerase [Gemmataceae bacterium]
MAIPLRIKICGVTSVEDACLAAKLGADAIGLNFSEQSPRRTDLDTARAIMAALPPFVDSVGVFTDAAVLGDLFMKLGVRGLQWHGELEELPEFTPGVMMMYRLIVAFRIRDRQTLTEADAWLKARRAWALPAAILIDGYKEGVRGGTGTPPPWPLLAGYPSPAPLILAGGLTPDNVANAVRIVRPYAVDVASGVESSPGKKDADKMRRFIENARQAASELKA